MLLDPNFARFVGDLRGKRVLDAGCGEGDSSRILARNGAAVVGIDISDAMLELAKTEEARNPLGIEYR
ncbi:MAG TPA: methyltransferase domain-containing protein, partial [Rhodospirillales bacterium]